MMPVRFDHEKTSLEEGIKISSISTMTSISCHGVPLVNINGEKELQEFSVLKITVLTSCTSTIANKNCGLFILEDIDALPSELMKVESSPLELTKVKSDTDTVSKLEAIAPLTWRAFCGLVLLTPIICPVVRVRRSKSVVVACQRERRRE